MSKTNYDIYYSRNRYLIPFQVKGVSYQSACNFIEGEIGELGKKVWQQVRIDSDLLGGEAEEKRDSDLYDYVRNEFRWEKGEKNPAEEIDNQEKKGIGWVMNPGAKTLPAIKFTRKSICLEVDLSAVGLFLFRNGLGIFWYEIELDMPPGKTTCLSSQEMILFQNAANRVGRDVDRDGNSNFTKILEGDREERFSFGEWISNLLKPLSAVYFAHSADKGEEVPSEALLFSYYIFKSEEEMKIDDLKDTLYHLTNGYESKILYSSELGEDMRRPFANALWYATKRGCTYASWVSEATSHEFSSMYGRVNRRYATDYFTMYLKVLYQSYSLLFFAQRIQTDISSDLDKEDEGVESEKALQLFKEINLFLAKSMATSVSFTHHQTDFYNYLKQQNRVHEDIKSVTAGLESIESLLRDKREEREKESDNKIQAILTIFAVLGIGSAFVDWYDFLGEIWDSNWASFSSGRRTAEWIALSVITLISIIGIIILWKPFVKILKEINAKTFGRFGKWIKKKQKK